MVKNSEENGASDVGNHVHVYSERTLTNLNSEHGN
jgi:hypothetical protein